MAESSVAIGFADVRFGILLSQSGSPLCGVRDAANFFRHSGLRRNDEHDCWRLSDAVVS